MCSFQKLTHLKQQIPLSVSLSFVEDQPQTTCNVSVYLVDIERWYDWFRINEALLMEETRQTREGW